MEAAASGMRVNATDFRLSSIQRDDVHGVDQRLIALILQLVRLPTIFFRSDSSPLHAAAFDIVDVDVGRNLLLRTWILSIIMPLLLMWL